mmetsp:Transcript_53508/g.148355  ORF Transcript_53508/g.148355 Transcript_53508/m.148355 type:complete len:357 (-) Transcript_53508:59-1129(-)
MRFVSCPVDRAATISLRRDPRTVRELLESADARFVLVHTKKILGLQQGSSSGVTWWKRPDLLALVPQADDHAVYLGPLRGPGPLAGHQAFAMDVGTLVSEADVLAAVGPPSPDVALRWWGGRDLMLSDAPDFDVTVAGMALAMTGWHASAKFDGSTGLPTVPIEGGAKRQVEGGTGKLYPRTDPVAIGLIVSKDGQRCLLGRGPKHPPGMYTCLAGFVDQCESVEEALRREALEEAGVRLGPVRLVMSQPWPIGRAGSCELMMGCRAVALQDQIKVNPSELQDARWFTRAEVQQMLRGTHPAKLTVPPSSAIAHHLISSFIAPSAVAGRSVGVPALACLVGLAAGMLLAALLRLRL